MMKAMWNADIYTTKEADVAIDIQSKFLWKYMCLIMDRLTLNIVGMIANEEVFQWRGSGKIHIFFYFFFDARDDVLVKSRGA